MSSLLPPNSHAERLSQHLEKAMYEELVPENGGLIYIGCCIDMDEEALNLMVDSDEWVEDGDNTDHLDELRDNCQGFDIWEKEMGYTEAGGLHLEDDWSVGYGKGTFGGHPCLWVCHSHIEWVWAQPMRFEADTVGTLTGRMSCSQPNIANKPGYDADPRVVAMIGHTQQEERLVAEMTKGTVSGRLSAKNPQLSQRPKCKHGNAGPCMECRGDPAAMKVIPYAVLTTDLAKWGCCYCGYAQGHIGVNKETGMPATAEGTYVWFCNSCRKFTYALALGVERSTIPFGGQTDGTTAYFPALTAHPREGQEPHRIKVDQSEAPNTEVFDPSEHSS